MRTEPTDGLLWKYQGLTEEGHLRTSFLDDKLFRVTQPSALNDPFEMKPRVLLDRYAPEDWEVAREQARRAGMPPEVIEDDEELKDLFLASFPSGRFDEKTTPGLWPTHIKELRQEPFHNIAELDAVHAERVRNDVEKLLDATVGVFSLSDNPRQLLMWSHYGGEHRGIAVGFDPKHSFFHSAGVLQKVNTCQSGSPFR